ncbi:MAG: DUF389 domain-containing protein [Gemmatimonas sp.]
MPDTDEHKLNSLFARLHHWRVRLVHAASIPDFSEEEAAALRHSVQQDGGLTSGYVLMCALSAGIATLGLLQSSVAVVIGAMLVSPLMSPIAALGFGFASLDGHRIKDAVRVVIIGAAIGVITGMMITWISPIRNATPEIIGRTQPTLLDLAIALLSGLAGGYATVRQKGGTAIGVAIATALMPPLATVGYGIGVANWEFAGGAFLLFLTNLAAIAFSFAFVARVSGVARPLSHVELTPGYIATGVAAFIALATPLGMTLVRVSRETRARSTTRSVLTSELHVSAGKIAQLEVRWPLLGELSVDAVVIEPTFLANAQQIVDSSLQRVFSVRPNVNLQQIVAADNGEQTRAMIDAAMERNAAGIAKDVPPFAQILGKVILPVQSVWVDRGARIVHVTPADAPNWSLADYRSNETIANVNSGDWKVHIVPPVNRTLSIPFPIASAIGDSITQKALSVALWTLQRWGMTNVILETTVKSSDTTATNIAKLRSASVAALLASASIHATFNVQSAKASANAIDINVFPPAPTAVAAPAAIPKNNK